MKTLDEVIACLDGCGCIDCDDCPYHYEDEKIEVDDCTQSYKDALHYLKEYRDECNNIINVHDDYVNLRNEMAEELNKKNPPLDWEQLKQMEGKPVWLESKRYGDHWYLLEYVYHDSLDCIGIYEERVSYDRDDDDWQAYRKERK